MRILENMLNEDKIVKIEIDFEELKKNQINESFVSMFGSAVKLLMGYLLRQPGGHLSGNSLSSLYNVSGRRSDVTAFARALGNEKSYIEAIKQNGLDHPDTFKSKTTLQRAIQGFEKATGLKWPFK